MERSEERLPQARSEGLLQRELPDGMIVYDTQQHHAHSLNRAAALIWQHCDGRTRVTELATHLRQLDLPADETLIWLALDRLEKANLLQYPVARPAEAVGLSRRAVVRKLGLAAGVVALVPLIESLSASPAHAAASCPPTSGCAGNYESCMCKPCCSGLVCTSNPIIGSTCLPC